MEWYVIAIRLGLSVIVGLSIGLQRELTGHPAGIKTNCMVSLGATIIALIQVQMASQFPETDNSRIIAQIVSGIGFLGAGCILHTGASNSIVKGLTTASTLWVVAGLGIASGLGYYEICGIGVAVALFVLIVFGTIRKLIRKKKPDSNITSDDADF